MIDRRGFLALASAALASGGWARGVDAGAPAALEARVAGFDRIMERGDYLAALDYLPPATVRRLCEMAGTDLAGLRDRMAEQVEDMKATIDVSQMRFALGLDKARFGTTAKGRAWAAMTSTTKIGPDWPEMTAPVMALEDDGTWYLIRLDGEGHRTMLAELYPDLRPVIETLGETP